MLLKILPFCPTFSRVKLDEFGATHSKNDARLQTLDQQISELLGEIDKRDSQLTSLRDAVDQLQRYNNASFCMELCARLLNTELEKSMQSDLRTLARERLTMTAAIDQRSASVSTMRAALTQLTAAADALRAELAAPLHSKLSYTRSLSYCCSFVGIIDRKLLCVCFCAALRKRKSCTSCTMSKRSCSMR